MEGLHRSAASRRPRTTALWRIVLPVWLALAQHGCEPGSGSGPKAGSESHFLEDCARECPGELGCICGVCSVPCERDPEVCAALSPASECSAPAANECSAAVQACDVACERGDDCASLGAEFACVAGRCRVSAAPAPSSDAALDTTADAAAADTGAGAGALELPAVDCERMRCIPSTGQRQCFDHLQALPACARPAGGCGDEPLCGQDGDYHVARAFACRDGSGAEKPCTDAVAPDDVVEDPLSGLSWQRVTPTDYTASCGDAGGCSAAEATALCEGLTLGGLDDFRLPELAELLGLAVLTQTDVNLDPVAFPNAAADWFWTSTSREDFDYPGERQHWVVHSVAGAMDVYRERPPFPDLPASLAPTAHARCVRGEPKRVPQPRYRVAGEGGDSVAIDMLTGRMWQADPDVLRQWPEALAYCETLAHAGFDDWRLPDVHELYSLFDAPYLQGFFTTALPDTAAGFYWSSSTLPGQPQNAATVDLSSPADRESSHLGQHLKAPVVPDDSVDLRQRVRCVRGEVAP